VSLELFKTNADICIKMASTTTNAEVRQQWTELAAQWRTKADAYKLESKAVACKGTTLSEISLFSFRDASMPQPPKHIAAVARETPPTPIGLVPDIAQPLFPRPEHGTLDALWEQFKRFSGKSKPAPSPAA